MATKTFKIGLSNTDKQNMAQDVYERLLALTFAEYDSNETYNTGDFVVYDDVLYQCLADNVTGAWDSTKWQQATLQDLLDDIEDAVAFVNDKANVDGNYPTMTVGAADNLTPYDEESGVLQQQPFLFQGTGCGNGEQQVDTGALALLKEKQGHSVVVNQQIQDNFDTGTGWTESNVSVTFSDNQAHITGTGNFNGSIYKNGNPKVSGHKYLIIFEAKASVNSNFGYGFAATYKTTIFSATTSWGIFFNLITTSSDNSYEYIYYAPTGETLDVKNFLAIDLTQWFGSDDNIPPHLLAHPEDFFRYYQGSLAYNTGTLVNSNGRYLKTIGRNQWDEETYNRVIPNTKYFVSKSATITYYDKDKNSLGTESVNAKDVITIPSNCIYINSSVSSITISIAYYKDAEETELESGYIDNGTAIEYLYEELANIDTGTETLRSAGSMKDSKSPDGTITRNIKDYTVLGTETITGQENLTNYRWISIDNLPDIKDEGASTSKNFFMVDYQYVSSLTDVKGAFLIQGTLWLSYLRTEYANDSEFLATLVGKHIYYPLTTPTTEQGTPYSENVAIDDFGSMDFTGTNGVPQGNSIFYPVDYKAFIDTLYNQVGGDGNNVLPKKVSIDGTPEALPDDAPASLKQLLDYIDGLHAIEQANAGGTLRQLLSNQFSIDFLDTDYIDLGNQNWIKNAGQSEQGYDIWYCILSGTVSGKTVCSLFKNNPAPSSGWESLADGECYLGSNYLAICSSMSYTDATAFKNAMKGVLLAYEKASS